MDNEPRDPTPSARTRGRPSYPLHKVVAAIAPAETDGVVTALRDAGFTGEQVKVVTAEDVPGLNEAFGGSGIR